MISGFDEKLPDAHDVGPGPSIRPRILNELRPYWVQQHVRRHAGRVFLSAQNPFVVATLPQVRLEKTTMSKPTPLLKPRHEAPQIRVLTPPFHQQVGVVRHEAVRNDCELLHERRAPHLREDGFDDVVRGEAVAAPVCAQCEEIAVETRVCEGGEARGSAVRHDARIARCVPVRSKRDGGAEAPPYDCSRRAAGLKPRPTNTTALGGGVVPLTARSPMPGPQGCRHRQTRPAAAGAACPSARWPIPGGRAPP